MTNALLAWVSLLPAGLTLALMPGPNNLLSVQVAVARGVRAACLAALGRLAAFALLLTASAVGLVAALDRLPWLLLAVQTAAALYLLWLAAQGWARAGAPRAVPVGVAADPKAEAWRREFWVAIGNPKCLLIATAFLPQFVQPGAPALPQVIAGSALVLALEALAVLAYALGGALLQRWLDEPATARRFTRGCHVLMAGAALWLLWRTWA
ncbi:MAG TPA: LysE family transporter [Methylibium sp.]|nr:LysE family transporter [Methylibium sp.]